MGNFCEYFDLRGGGSSPNPKINPRENTARDQLKNSSEIKSEQTAGHRPQDAQRPGVFETFRGFVDLLQ